ncbi:ribonuclease pancreatic-like [Pangshura tecta]
MALRGPCPAHLLPLILLITCLALDGGQSCTPPFKTFLWEHVDFLRTSFSKHNAYCTSRMRRLNLFKKPLNTFIHIPIEAIKSVCRVHGTHFPPNLRKSKYSFAVTTCRYNKLLYGLHLYNGTFYRRQIIIGCCHAFPVYYHE